MGLRLGGSKVVPAPAPVVEAPPPSSEIESASEDLYEILCEAVRELESGDQFALVNAFQSNQPWQSAPPRVRALITGVVREFLE